METKTNLKDLIDSHKFDGVNPSITSETFSEEDIRGDDYKLFHFERYLSSEEAIKEMEKEGYSAANLYELLSWKEWNKKDSVISLGSVVKVLGGRHVPCLGGSDSKRYLNLDWWVSDWYADYRFLGVRNSSLKDSEPKESVIEPLDTMPLILIINGVEYRKYER